MMQKHALLMAATVCLAVLSGFAQTNGLVQPLPVAATPAPQRPGELGDPAPPLTVQEWIKGRPVKIQPGTNVYVLVFCTLSHANEFAITNLSALQQMYQDKGVVTVVISDEAPQQLKDCVRLQGGEMNFTVAADDLAARTARNYQQAFKQFMSPRAYVVGRDAKVLWYGHPLRDGMGKVVDDIVSGRYDLDQARKNVRDNQQMEIYLAMAREGDPATAKSGQAMLMLRTNDLPALCKLAFQIATDPYIEQRDVALANEALDRAAQLATTNVTDIAVTRAILVFQSGHQEEGLACAKQLLGAVKTDPDVAQVKACIRAMEVRMAMVKTNQAAAVSESASTNAVAGQH
jgi:hypothetical protein